MYICSYYWFSENTDKKELCMVKYYEKDLELLKNAIEDLYYFEFVIGTNFWLVIWATWCWNVCFAGYIFICRVVAPNSPWGVLSSSRFLQYVFKLKIIYIGSYAFSLCYILGKLWELPFLQIANFETNVIIFVVVVEFWTKISFCKKITFTCSTN